MTRIVVSGDLDEWKIRELIAADAPIDAYAVGTALTTSRMHRRSGGVYKLVEIEGPGGARLVLKRSAGKRTQPGAKQVWRILRGGLATHDVVALAGEPPPEHGIPLLRPVMRSGARLGDAQPLAPLRAGCAERFSAMPDSIPLSIQASITASTSVKGSGPIAREERVTAAARDAVDARNPHLA